MKPKTKILILLFGLVIPYMGVVLYRVFAHPENIFPKWFLYSAPLYFVACIATTTFLARKISASAPPPRPAERLKSARAVRRMGYLWWIGPVFYFLDGGLREPLWITIAGLCWVSFLSWVCFREAKKLEEKAQQPVV